MPKQTVGLWEKDYNFQIDVGNSRFLPFGSIKGTIYM